MGVTVCWLSSNGVVVMVVTDGGLSRRGNDVHAASIPDSQIISLLFPLSPKKGLYCWHMVHVYMDVGEYVSRHFVFNISDIYKTPKVLK